MQNYRPISILPGWSKISEKIVFNHLTNYLESHKILCASQYGFRKNISTYLLLIDMYDKISTACDRNEYAIGIFIDLCKAFDTLDHSILLRKLYHYGIRGITHDWFASYLTNRKQYVLINNTDSSFESINCGVSQGSILGLLLFLIYINDIINCSKFFKFILFADNTNIFYSCNNLCTLENTVNSKLLKLSRWFCANHLSLKIKKTN